MTLGGLLGRATHSVLDGVVNADIHPLAPFSAQNPFHDVLSVLVTHSACLLAGAVGLALLMARRSSRERTRAVRPAQGGIH